LLDSLLESIRESLPKKVVGMLFKSDTSLSALLEVTQGHKSRDPRDRYFALLGLYDRKRFFGTKARNFLKADYSKSLSKVLCEVTKFIVETEGNLNVLSHAGYKGKRGYTFVGRDLGPGSR